MVSFPTEPLCVPVDADIANAASLSPVINLNGHVIAGLMIPATWTAAVVTFSGSIDGITYADVHNSSGEVSVAGTAGTYFAVNPVDFYGVNYVKVRSGTSASSVNQAADRTIVMAMSKPDFR